MEPTFAEIFRAEERPKRRSGLNCRQDLIVFKAHIRSYKTCLLTLALSAANKNPFKCLRATPAGRYRVSSTQTKTQLSFYLILNGAVKTQQFCGIKNILRKQRQPFTHYIALRQSLDD